MSIDTRFHAGRPAARREKACDPRDARPDAWEEGIVGVIRAPSGKLPPTLHPTNESGLTGPT